MKSDFFLMLENNIGYMYRFNFDIIFLELLLLKQIKLRYDGDI